MPKYCLKIGFASCVVSLAFSCDTAKSMWEADLANWFLSRLIAMLERNFVVRSALNSHARLSLKGRVDLTCLSFESHLVAELSECCRLDVTSRASHSVQLFVQES